MSDQDEPNLSEHVRQVHKLEYRKSISTATPRPFVRNMGISFYLVDTRE